MNIEANIRVGKVLRTLRMQRGLTQAELGEKLDRPQSFISKIESGERGVYAYELVDFSEALDIDVAETTRVIKRECQREPNTLSHPRTYR